MLSRLRIRNFALVEDLELEFQNGLTVVTGETGAGKSVLVNAIALILGARAEREQIRHGFASAEIEAELDMSVLPKQTRDAIADYLDDNSLLSIRRLISREGNSSVELNGQKSTLTQLTELVSPLAEIMGQHANQTLMDENNHLLFLDSFGQLDIMREDVAQLFDNWQLTRTQLSRLRKQRDQLVKERELLLFQQKEITDAKIKVGEESDLNNELRILNSSRQLMESSEAVIQLVDGEEGSALRNLRLARKELEKMAGVDESLDKQLEELSDLDFRLEEFRRFVERYGSSIADDPQRIEEINERLDEIYQLKQKYGGSEEAIIKTLADIEKKLEKRPDTDSQIAQVERQESEQRQQYADKAIELSGIRKTAAQYLQKLVVKELAELSIESGGFEFEFEYLEDSDGIELEGTKVKPTPFGLETGRFIFSANPGEPLKSMVKTASGGEISRILLAIKAAEKKQAELSQSLLIFDEVDAGIGGQTANAIAQKLKRLSENRQVIVITHLHQIARIADHHFAVEKKTGKARAIISIRSLQDREKAAEIDRMVALPVED